MKNPLLFVILFFTSSSISHNLYSQLIPIELDEKIEQSELIVEAEVIKSESYRGDDGRIYTKHTLAVSRSWNGEITEEIKVITRGGVVDGSKETWSHIIKLKREDRGIFFLFSSSLPESPNKQENEYEIYSSEQGFVKFHSIGNRRYGQTPFKTYNNIDSQLIQKLSVAFGDENNYSTSNKEEGKCLVYKFQPVLETSSIESLKLAVDIKVKMSKGTQKLYKSLAVVEYDSDIFGTNIVSNGKLTFDNGSISELSSYNLTISDLTSNKFELRLEANQTANLYDLNASYSWLARLYLEIQNPLGIPNFILDEVAMQNGNQYYDSDANLGRPFDCIKIIDEVSLLICPEITSFSPASISAGIGDTLTVFGSNFGQSSNNITPPDSAALLLRKVTQGADNGSLDWVQPYVSEYTTWTDTMIRAVIGGTGPLLSNSNFRDSPGTGLVGVLSDGCIDSTSANLRVNYATNDFPIAHPQTGLPLNLPIYLADKNGNGGYDIVFDSTFINIDSSAVGAFNRALETWRCATGVNFNTQIFDSIPVQLQVNACLITYGNMPAGVPSATIAHTNADNLGFCGSGGIATYSILNSFSIVFSDKKVWQTTTSMPMIDFQDTIDMETTALHELGHAHLLLHTNNLSNTMYHAVTTYDRTLDGDDVDGGSHIVHFSSEEVSGCAAGLKMIAVPFSECEDILNGIFTLADEDFPIHIYPNPTQDWLVIEVQNLGEQKNNNIHLEIYNNLGCLLLNQTINSKKEQVDVSTLSKGTLVGVLKSKGRILTSFKFIKI